MNNGQRGTCAKWDTPRTPKRMDADSRKSIGDCSDAAESETQPQSWSATSEQGVCANRQVINPAAAHHHRPTTNGRSSSFYLDGCRFESCRAGHSCIPALKDR